MKSKNGQINFSWIFAIVVGGMILVLAIYGAMKAGDTVRYQSDTNIAKKISILTNPMQAGFAEGSYSTITFKEDTLIRNTCLDNEFGRNEINVATRSDVGEEWNLEAGTANIPNKYIFSERQNIGTDYYVFSKPFEFPYKVSDLIFLVPERYCFFDAPEEITDELVKMKIPNIEIDECSYDDANRVCFGNGDDCDVVVRGSCVSGCDSVYDSGIVEKTGVEMKYVGNLMYAAIFADKGNYDCNVKRLLYRSATIADEFVDKADLMSARGCNTNMRGDLTNWYGLTIDATSDNLMGLRTVSKAMNRKNNLELCGIW